jgi:hypothetical protein
MTQSSSTSKICRVAFLTIYNVHWDIYYRITLLVPLYQCGLILWGKNINYKHFKKVSVKFMVLHNELCGLCK